MIDRIRDRDRIDAGACRSRRRAGRSPFTPASIISRPRSQKSAAANRYHRRGDRGITAAVAHHDSRTVPRPRRLIRTIVNSP